MTGRAQGDAKWPFVILYLFMLASMIGVSLNSDPITFTGSFAVFFGVIAVAGLASFIAWSAIKRKNFFGFEGPSLLGNLARHIFILTGIVFTGFLLFDSLVAMAIVLFNAPVFAHSCPAPGQRDVALFVWDGITKGMLGKLTSALHLDLGACKADANSLAVEAFTIVMRLFASFVLIWYLGSLARNWYARLRPGGTGGEASAEATALGRKSRFRGGSA